MLLQVFQGPRPSFVYRVKRQENMGSARNVARYITRGRVTRVVIILVGTVAAVGDGAVDQADLGGRGQDAAGESLRHLGGGGRTLELVGSQQHGAGR